MVPTLTVQLRVSWSAWAAQRFWLISTKVDKKIASTDANIADITKDGSNRFSPGHPGAVLNLVYCRSFHGGRGKPRPYAHQRENCFRFHTIQSPKRTKWMKTKILLPVKQVTASASWSCHFLCLLRHAGDWLAPDYCARQSVPCSLPKTWIRQLPKQLQYKLLAQILSGGAAAENNYSIRRSRICCFRGLRRLPV